MGLMMITLASLLLASSCMSKFLARPATLAHFAQLGFVGRKLTFVAILELIGAVSFLVPRTRSFGVLWVSAYLGGAICVHVQADEFDKAVTPAIVLAVSWIGTLLRHPQMLWSMAGPPNSFRQDIVTEAP